MQASRERRAVKTAGRLLVPTVLGALALAGAMTVSGAPSKPDFALAVSPTSQSVSQGSSATFSVTITRQGGFSSAVALSVTGLASGMTASFSSNPTAGTTTTMTVTTSAATPVGSKALNVTGTGGGLTRTAAFSLNVQLSATPAFNLTVTPTARTISQDDSASFDVSITRLNGFSSPVALTVTGLPRKTTGTFSPATIPSAASTSTLTLVAEHNADVGSFPLTITASGGSVTRTAAVTLTIAKKQVFLIAGNASTLLYPGASSVFDLTLTNPNSFPIRVGPLLVSIEERTSIPACSGTSNFVTAGLVGTVDVPANATATLTQLGVANANLPRVTFVLNPANQDVCKNAQLAFQYSGTAVKP